MPAPHITPGTEKRIALLFPPHEQDWVRHILVQECAENIYGWQGAGLERLHFAVLKISEGKLDRLRGAIETAKSDFRDALVWAGFGEPDIHRRWTPAKKW